MLMHLIKLIWNRKRANLLIMIEVAITFIVLFALISTAWHFFLSYTSPLGYKVENTWSIRLSSEGRWNNETDREPLNQLVEVLRQQKQITSAEMTQQPLLRNSQWSSSEMFEGSQLSYDRMMVTDNGPKSWGVKLNQGRWFSPVDEGQPYRPVMVNQLFVDTYFKGREVIGLEIPVDEGSISLPKRIVGVFNELRQRGDFQEPLPMMLGRYSPVKGAEYGMSYIHVTFDQKPTATYEQTLMKLLKNVAPQWEHKITSWEKLRDNINQDVAMPMTILSIVVVFLLLMVAMGLFGILWQNINQRTAEIGLRRAIGASSASVTWQIIGETVTLAAFAMLLSTIVLIQVPMLQLIETVTWSNFFVSLLASSGIIVTIVVLCAVYPALVAVNKTPAMALHYE